MRKVHQDHGVQEQLALKDTAAMEAESKETSREKKVADKQAEKAMAAELSNIEKMLAAREKDRQIKWRQAAGLSRGGGGGRGGRRRSETKRPLEEEEAELPEAKEARSQ